MMVCKQGVKNPGNLKRLGHGFPKQQTKWLTGPITLDAVGVWICLCIVVPGERRGVWSLPCGTVRLSDRSAHQAEGQAAHQSHQGEGVQSEGKTGWLTDCLPGSLLWFNRLDGEEHKHSSVWFFLLRLWTEVVTPSLFSCRVNTIRRWTSPLFSCQALLPCTR